MMAVVGVFFSRLYGPLNLSTTIFKKYFLPFVCAINNAKLYFSKNSGFQMIRSVQRLKKLAYDNRHFGISGVSLVLRDCRRAAND